MIILLEQKFFFVACQMKFLGLHDFTQSIQVLKPSNESLIYPLIKFDDILHKKPYCSNHITNNQFVIIDNRDILKT